MTRQGLGNAPTELSPPTSPTVTSQCKEATTVVVVGADAHKRMQIGSDFPLGRTPGQSPFPTSPHRPTQPEQRLADWQRLDIGETRV